MRTGGENLAANTAPNGLSQHFAVRCDREESTRA
jgi:hypothetical protein